MAFGKGMPIQINNGVETKAYAKPIALCTVLAKHKTPATAKIFRRLMSIAMVE